MPSAHRTLNSLRIDCPRCGARAGRECEVARDHPGPRACKERIKAYQSRDRSADLAVPCPRCGAREGEQCKASPSGRTCRERGAK
jgi:uncharacterized C2H2 Zn-finger protein